MNVWQKYRSVESAAVDIYHRMICKELIDLFSGPRRRVVEIGSSGGYTGQYCQQEFPGVEYWGFELNRAATRELPTQLDKVAVGRFEEQEPGRAGPATALGRWHGAGRRAGAPVRPLARADFAAALADRRRRGNHQPAQPVAAERDRRGPLHLRRNGLLDVTHIRCFTLRKIYAMMDSTGYIIVQDDIALDDRLAEFHAQHVPRLQAGVPSVFHYKSISIQAGDETLSESCARQFMFRAMPRRTFRELTPTSPGQRLARLAADYDALASDPLHHASRLPPPPSTPRAPVELYAFYLPQYLPTPKNSKWWGEGFTEWTNTKRARASFSGQYQSRHPGELGYCCYDLRVPELMARQIEPAKQAGLAGFIFYYYWFSGTPMLDMPLRQYKERWQEFGLPFFVMWCNENRRRNWVDGGAHDTQQDMLLVYPLVGPDGTADIAATRATVSRWRDRARELGLGELWIGGQEKTDLMAAGTLRGPQDLGVDFFFEFPPPNSLTCQPADSANGVHDFYKPDHRINFVCYETLMDKLRALPAPKAPLVNTVLAGSWDNTARKCQSANVFHGCTPPLYRRWLRESARFARAHPARGGCSMVFNNAWNERAEGVYLKPDRKFGDALLAATQRVTYGLSG